MLPEFGVSGVVTEARGQKMESLGRSSYPQSGINDQVESLQ